MRISDLLLKTIDNRGKTPPVTSEGNLLLEINCIAGEGKYPDYSVVKKYVDERTYETWFRSGHPSKGDILIPTVGTLDAIAVMNRDDCCIAQNVVALRVNPEICDCDFLYYLLRDPQNRQRVLKLDIGAVQPSIKVPHLKDLEVTIPSLVLQKKIATILSELDDKIEINKKINDNLSEQIQTIYRESFNPTMHQPLGVLSDICHYSSERVSISDLSVSTYFSTENMQPNKAGAVNATSLPKVSQTTKCHKGDVLVSNIRPYFKKIVYVTADCGCSMDVLCFVPNEGRLSAFLFSTVYADQFFDYMMLGTKGTKMPRGDKQQIMKYPVVLPSDDSLATFTDTVKPMLETISNNRVENIRLAGIRDALLPQLMTGALDISGIKL